MKKLNPLNLSGFFYAVCPGVNLGPIYLKANVSDGFLSVTLCQAKTVEKKVENKPAKSRKKTDEVTK